MFVPRSSFQMPTPCMANIIVASSAAPSTIAASITWPLPVRCALRMPQTTP